VFIVIAVLIQSDASPLDDRAPLCRFITHHSGEAIGWPTQDFHASAVETRANLGLGEGRIDFSIEFLNDLSGRADGRDDAIPERRDDAW
jgi:hypothetical protein